VLTVAVRMTKTHQETCILGGEQPIFTVETEAWRNQRSINNIAGVRLFWPGARSLEAAMRFVEQTARPRPKLPSWWGAVARQPASGRRQQIKSDTPDHAAPIALVPSHHSLCDHILFLLITSLILYQPHFLSSAALPLTLHTTTTCNTT
jgi:hypothetical protein